MQIFIDSANLKEIKNWLRYGVIDGVTTNPSIMLSDGIYNIEEGVKIISAVLGKRHLSVEVTTNDEHEMIEQGRLFSKWAQNIIVKIPIINENGLPSLEAIKTLEEEGIKVNATAILSFGQVALSAKAGATYASIFAGRVADEGGDASSLIRMAREWIDAWGYKTKIIVGSIRGVIDIQNAAVAGAHVITIPPKFLYKMIDHKYTRDTVKGFINDAMEALMKMPMTNSLETEKKYRQNSNRLAKGKSEKRLLGRILLSRDSVTDKQLEEALSIQPKTKESIGKILTRLGYIGEEELGKALNIQLGLDM